MLKSVDLLVGLYVNNNRFAPSKLFRRLNVTYSYGLKMLGVFRDIELVELTRIKKNKRTNFVTFTEKGKQFVKLLIKLKKDLNRTKVT